MTLAAIDAAGDRVRRGHRRAAPDRGGRPEDAHRRLPRAARPRRHHRRAARRHARAAAHHRRSWPARCASGTRVLQPHAGAHRPARTRRCASLGTVARDPAAAAVADQAHATALQLLRPTLADLRAAQVGCNLLAVNLRNQGDAVSRGDQQGTWLSFLPLIDLDAGPARDRAVARTCTSTRTRAWTRRSARAATSRHARHADRQPGERRARRPARRDEPARRTPPRAPAPPACSTAIPGRAPMRPAAGRTALMLGVVGIALIIAWASTSSSPSASRSCTATGSTRTSRPPTSSSPGFSPVRIAGVTVGKVTKIDRGGPGNLTPRRRWSSRTRRCRSTRTRGCASARACSWRAASTSSSTPAARARRSSTSDRCCPRNQTAGPGPAAPDPRRPSTRTRWASCATIVKELDNGARQRRRRGPRPRDRGVRARCCATPPRSPRRRAATRPHDVSEGIAATSKITAALAAREERAARPGHRPQRDDDGAGVARRRGGAHDHPSSTGCIQRDARARSTASTRVMPTFRRFVAALRPSLRVAAAGPRRHHRDARPAARPHRPASCPRCSTRSARRVRGLPRLGTG